MAQALTRPISFLRVTLSVSWLGVALGRCGVGAGGPCPGLLLLQLEFLISFSPAMSPVCPEFLQPSLAASQTLVQLRVNVLVCSCTGPCIYQVPSFCCTCRAYSDTTETGTHRVHFTCCFPQSGPGGGGTLSTLKGTETSSQPTPTSFFPTKGKKKKFIISF